MEVPSGEVGRASRLDHALERLPRSHFQVGPWRWPTWLVCGLVGVALGSALSLALIGRHGGRASMVVVLVVAGLATFVVLAYGSKILTGHEMIVFYHHAVAILGVHAVLLLTLQEPVLPYLDVVALGLLVILACGRVGCLMAGCCHGKPARHGIRYRALSESGVPWYYDDVRLFPVQALESALVLAILLGGVAFLFGRPAPGETLVLVLVSYALARFALEEARGDPGRPVAWGVSHGQWTSFLVCVGSVAAAAAGLLPRRGWQWGVAVVLVTALVARIWMTRRRPLSRRALLSARHVDEVASVLASMDPVAADPERVAVATTSLGFGLSAGREPGGDVHYGMSRQGGLDEDQARLIAALILALRHPAARATMLPGSAGVFHVLVAGGGRP